MEKSLVDLCVQHVSRHITSMQDLSGLTAALADRIYAQVIQSARSDDAKLRVLRLLVALRCPLSSLTLRSDTIKILPFINLFPNLAHLQLSRVQLDPASWRVVAALPLTTLQLVGVDGIPTKALTAITKQNTHLTQLDIRSTLAINNNHCELMSESFLIHHLGLSYCRNVTQINAIVVKFPNLKSISVGGTSCSFLHVVNTLPIAITSLNIERLDVDDRNVSLLRNFPHLRELRMANVQVSNAAALSALTELTVLDLGYSLVNDNSLEALKALRHLAWLSLQSTRLRHTNLRCLAVLQELKHLDLSMTGVGTNVEAISSLREMHRLRFLYVADTKLPVLELQEHLALTIVVGDE